ncbi:ABC transporter permease [Angustibacter sp. McL0619]|uniref:ABC transporter permease n=1 Tax=Angustibacter sp. McL0619 TaxID=3415676 RepID=UPI003CF08194
MADLLRDLPAYRVLLGSRMAAQTSYRTSFALDLLGQLGLALLELSEIYVVFHNVDMLGGLDFGAALLVFALANVSWSVADTLVGHLDTLPTYIRTGTLDAMLLRPLPVLAQLVTSDVSLRRLARTAMGLVVLVAALPLAVDDWTPARVVLLVVTPVTGAAIFAALFVCATGAQFWLVDGSEMTNGFTYGSSYVASYPTSVLHGVARTFFTFVVPAAFVSYLPALAITGQEGAPGLPSWLGWCTPLMALLIWGAALQWWRFGLRHYTGAGG